LTNARGRNSRAECGQSVSDDRIRGSGAHAAAARRVAAETIGVIAADRRSAPPMSNLSLRPDRLQIDGALGRDILAGFHTRSDLLLEELALLGCELFGKDLRERRRPRMR